MAAPLLLATLMATVSAPVSARASICQVMTVDATLARDLRSIHGHVTCKVAESGPLAVTTYPRLLRTAQAAPLNDINRLWFYPHGFTPADMTLHRDGTALPGSGPWQSLGDVSRGAWVRLDFDTTIPERNGTFGTRDGVAYLLGGWHPTFGRVGTLTPEDIQYNITVPADLVGFVGAQPFGRGKRPALQGHFRGHFVPVLAAPGALVRRGPGVVVVAPQRRAKPDLRLALGTPPEEEVLATLVEGSAFAAQQGLHVTPLIAVSAPLREHLVESFDGGLAIADRAFEVLPTEVLRKFYRFSVWREQLALLAAHDCERRQSNTVGSLSATLVADTIGSALRERLIASRYGRAEYAPELLETVAVIPEIDALIFAPQVPFIDAFYNALDETPSVRWRLDDFYHTQPRGKLLYEKLRDHLGESGVQACVTAYLQQGDADFITSASATAGRDVGALIAPWLGPYPRLNYHIAQTASDPASTHLEVQVEGPDAGRVLEPITVEVEDRHGTRHRAHRLGPGPLTLQIPGPPRRIELDPDGRLVELWHTPGTGPRFDNTVPPQWRFLLNDISGILGVTARQLTVSASFSLRRLHDLTYALMTSVLYSPAALTANVTGAYKFGSDITPLRRTQTLSLGTSYNRLRVEHGAAVPGDQAMLSFTYDYDNRLSRVSSFEGFAANVSLAAAAGVNAQNHRYAFVQAGAGILNIWPLGFRHALVGRLRADLSVGDTPPQNAWRLGGRYRGGRGFENDEARGMRRVLASGEYRHVLAADTHTDLFGVALLHRLEGALFADAIYLPVQSPGCVRTMFYDVGYGLRILADLFNMSPSAISIEVGVPIGRCADEAARRPPVTIYLAFVQSFLAF